MQEYILERYDCYNQKTNKKCGHDHKTIHDITHCLLNRINDGYIPRIIYRKQIGYQVQPEIESFILFENLDINLQNCINYYYVWYRKKQIADRDRIYQDGEEKYKDTPENLNHLY